MQGKYIFKKATLKDLDRFFVFFSQSIKEQFPQYTPKTRDYFIQKEYSPQSLKVRLKSKDIIIYLAIQDKQIVGYLMTGIIVGGVCLAIWLAVSGQHQGQGIGSQLLQMWEKDAKSFGIHKLHLWTDNKNVDFYKRRGFRLLGKISKNYYGVNDYLFYKSIQKPIEKNFLK